MLSLNEIRNVHFRKSNFSGYKAEDVEAFIDEVQQSYDQLLKENADLQKKVDVLAQKLEEYQHEEDAIRSALMNAQKLGDASLRDAKHKSEIILKDATIKAEKIVANAQTEIKREKEIVDRMQKDVADFKTNLLKLYKEHLQVINNIRSEDVLRPATREAAQSVQIITPQYDEHAPMQIPASAPVQMPQDMPATEESFEQPPFDHNNNMQYNNPPQFGRNEPSMTQPVPEYNPHSMPASPNEASLENTYMRNNSFERTPARGGFKVNIAPEDFQNNTDIMHQPPMQTEQQPQEPTFNSYMPPQQQAANGFSSTFAGNTMTSEPMTEPSVTVPQKSSPLGLFKRRR